MIDLQKEPLLSPSQARALFPPGRQGKRPSLATIHRWFSTGHNGLRLEFICTPHGRYTSELAVHRFLLGITEKAEAGNAIPTASQRRRRQREIASAEAEADRLLGSTK